MIFTVKTHKSQEVVNITDLVNLYFKELLSSSRIKDGFLVLYNPHTTSSLLINEGSDSSVAEDLLNTLNRLIPLHNNYFHDKVDDNAHAHLKTSLFHSNLMIPFSDGRLLLGTWQSIFLLEFDGPRTRKIYMHLVPYMI